MRKIKIITDSTCDLTSDILIQNDIDFMPLFVTIGNQTYKDAVDINCEQIFEKVEEFKELPKTACVSLGSLIEKFKEYIDQDYDIIYLGIGSGFSASYHNAILAKEDFDDDRIYVIDSKNLSSGVGLLLLKCVKFVKEGKSAKEIKDEIELLVPKVRTQFAINTLTYLHKGGRCSGTARLFGTLLNLKPIIRVVDGAMVVAKKPIGIFKRAYNTILEYVDQDIDNLDSDNIMITHASDPEGVQYFRKELLTRRIKVDNIIETQASCVISTHCGPKCIGILYITK